MNVSKMIMVCLMIFAFSAVNAGEASMNLQEREHNANSTKSNDDAKPAVK